MNIHITQITKQFLPENTFKMVERGVLDIPGKPSLNTFLVVGKYSKTGALENIPHIEIQDTMKKSKINPKWDGFKLV
jgi:hypothetical protein